MGSVRRVFTVRDRTSPARGDGSASSSPTKHHRSAEAAELPRRAASAGAMLWRRRQGARDWDVDVDGGNDEGEPEWDVESAVENRVVQLMFTVPKGKLRIVNGGPEGDGVSVRSKAEEGVGGV
ncbi:MAG: hypothetical protein FRX48_05852 [Lasallia pustulata]|uniref:Uncharacterized protein n=1 Tax=Lasallia pustulata TaxID=136370 RepID=A0A5M8PLS6_9LECA|nr:MAG: hypothetical protein FRX48_05852 [Lasallia pustulata]